MTTMDMEMTLNQKIEWVKDLLLGQHSLWNRSIFYIPASDIPDTIFEYFWEILQKFRHDGVIKEAYLGYAGLFDAEHIPEVFKKIDEDGKLPTADIDFFVAPKKNEESPESAVLKGKYKSKIIELLPTYYIEIDATKLNGAKSRITKEEVEFDALSGVISFGKTIYAFHKKGDKARRDFFRELWEKRKIIKAGEVKRKGELTPPETVATNLYFVDSAQRFDRNPAAKDKLNSLVKNLETNLRRKKLPIRIYKQGGIQIVVDIK